jgi:hypothetical protein
MKKRNYKLLAIQTIVAFIGAELTIGIMAVTIIDKLFF